MSALKAIVEWMGEQDISTAELAELAGLDRKVVEAIVAGRYTTSPVQRQRLADALGVAADQVRWGTAVNVDHMYGHGPQFGRSP